MKRVLKSLLSSIIVGSILISSISSVFASTTERIVKISINNQVANVNGENVTLSVAPYIQQPSESMMIPLRFVSTALGIPQENIQYNANTKEITITYNGTTAKFIVGTNKLILNNEEFSMYINNTNPVYTEIKNGSTFITLRALESAFGIKIDWVNETKTAILTNKIEDVENIEIDTFNSIKKNVYDEKVFLQLINDERAKYNLKPVEISNKLMETSKKKRLDMEERDYFSHTDPDGYNMAIDLGVAENCTTVSGVENAFRSWLSSKKGHREIMLDPNIKYIGISSYSYSVLHLSSNDKWANEN